MVKAKISVPFKNYLIISLVVAILTALLVLLSQKTLPPQVPLFYGAAEGNGQLVSSWGLVLPSVISIFVIIVNSALSSFLKDDFTKKILVAMAIVVTLFSVVTTFKVFFLVGSL